MNVENQEKELDMSEPKTRELSAVSKIFLLSEQETLTLYQILQVLGFDVGTIALLWDKPEDVVRQLFRTDQVSSKIHHLSLTGRDLTWWCESLRLRPGVVQQRLNFDESPLKLRRKGLKTMPWVGPPTFATKGATPEGRAFVELSGLVTLPTQSNFSSYVLSQMAVGKFPLRLPALRDLMAALEVNEIDHPKAVVIKAALAMFPKGVRTPEEMLEALTVKEEERKENQPSAIKEEPMRVEIIDRFRAEMAQRGILPALRQLHAESADIKQLCWEWNINVQGEIFPGCFEVIVTSAAFEAAAERWPTLTNPFQELGEWLKAERQKEEKKSAGRKVQKPDLVILPSKEEPKPVENQASSLFCPASPERPIRPVASGRTEAPKTPKPMVTLSRPTPVEPEQIETDEYGVVWNWTKRQVVLGAASIPMDPLSDARLQGGIRTLSKRVYDSLCTIRGAFRVEAVEFCQEIGVERIWFSGLVDSSSHLNPAILKGILDKLHRNYSIEMTSAQLFGLKPLPAMVTAKVQRAESGAVDVVAPVELLFPLGDARLGLMCSMMLRKYTSIRKWFEKTYGLTNDNLLQLESGQLGIPLAVYLVMMSMVKKRIDSVEGILVPTVYKRLIALPQSEPVRNGTFVLDETQTPHLDWLR